MSSLKPQPLPYTKRGIFGNTGQGITGIGTRVGQSVSGFLSSITTGVASNLLNRSLGLTPEAQSAATAQIQQAPTKLPNSSSTPDSNSTNPGPEQQQHPQPEHNEHPPTLIDSEIETLYSGFQKQHLHTPTDEDSSRTFGTSVEMVEADARSRRLRREEAKVRALNGNGRVDFSIQEGAFEISLLASIASHLSYWADEDVSHFVISQLLARQRVLKR